MIAREEARLRALFQRLLLLSAAAAPTACSTSSSDASDAAAPMTDSSTQTADAQGDDASSDAGAVVDATALDSTLYDAPGDDGSDAGAVWGFTDAACFASLLDSGPDGGDCQFFETLPCGLPPSTLVEACNLTYAECGTLCNQTQQSGHPCGIVECFAEDAGPEASVPAGPLTLECTTGLAGCAPGIGRRPCGLADAPPAASRGAAGEWLATAARLEAASVHAFRRLARDLASLHAPRALVRAAERSARDEVRHARVTRRLAARYGAHPGRVSIDRVPRSPSLESFAIENAVEGCVRECFGALIATHQAMRARDPHVSAAMARIARDETRHAALAWEIARWLGPQLDPEAHGRVSRAMRGAVASLRCELSATRGAWTGALGLPAPDAAERLVDGLAGALVGHAGARSTARRTAIHSERTP